VIASCPSSLALDRLLVGELALPERARIQRHIASCGRCRAFIADAHALATDAARAAASLRR